jgi:tRNA threonylcarbamoyladenosine biosynthesis protein TsaE
MVTNISRSPAETAAIGESWAATSQAGLVIALSGDLGAGKTQLVKGLAKGLGIAARVTSPTFALVNTYSGGRLTLFHLDLYRLDTREQIMSAGLDEYLHPQGVAVIEWAERWFVEKPQVPRLAPVVDTNQMPAGKIESQWIRWVAIDVIGETDRRISYEDFGA